MLVTLRYQWTLNGRPQLVSLTPLTGGARAVYAWLTTDLHFLPDWVADCINWINENDRASKRAEYWSGNSCELILFKEFALLRHQEIIDPLGESQLYTTPRSLVDLLGQALRVLQTERSDESFELKIEYEAEGMEAERRFREAYPLFE